MTLFALPLDEVAATSDDCYTPRWVFDAMGLRFDLDVAAPVGGPWHVPCERYYTAADDGLSQPWDGLVWCNPPYSNFAAWAARWAEHDRAVLMGFELPEVKWKRATYAAAEAVALIACYFGRPGDSKPFRLRQSIFVAFRGVGTEPAERLAAASPYGAALYGAPQSPVPFVDAAPLDGFADRSHERDGTPNRSTDEWSSK
jgi:hypothetical protein